MTADFDFYCNVFLGRLIPEENFSGLAGKAADFIRFAVGPWQPSSDQDRLALLKAVCAVAEILQDEEQSGSFAKETVGDYSVSYQSSSLSPERRKLDAIKIYLSGVPALAGLFRVRSFPCSHRIR
ncbi:MAG: hypothetical protein K2O18_02175 [Oscillospiraceae bacterium]|nr:hypothetical protein [Oscillospiraceae bacterium]